MIFARLWRGGNGPSRMQRDRDERSERSRLNPLANCKARIRVSQDGGVIFPKSRRTARRAGYHSDEILINAPVTGGGGAIIAVLGHNPEPSFDGIWRSPGPANRRWRRRRWRPAAFPHFPAVRFSFDILPAWPFVEWPRRERGGNKYKSDLTFRLYRCQPPRAKCGGTSR